MKCLLYCQVRGILPVAPPCATFASDRVRTSGSLTETVRTNLLRKTASSVSLRGLQDSKLVTMEARCAAPPPVLSHPNSQGRTCTGVLAAERSLCRPVGDVLRARFRGWGNVVSSVESQRPLLVSTLRRLFFSAIWLAETIWVTFHHPVVLRTLCQLNHRQSRPSPCHHRAILTSAFHSSQTCGVSFTPLSLSLSRHQLSHKSNPWTCNAQLEGTRRN